MTYSPDYGGHRIPTQQPKVDLGASQYQHVSQQMLAKGMADGLKLAIAEVWKAETQEKLAELLRILLKLAEAGDLQALDERLKQTQNKTWRLLRPSPLPPFQHHFSNRLQI